MRCVRQLVVVLLACTTAAAGAVAEVPPAYTVDLTLDPAAGRLTATVALELSAGAAGLESVDLLLNRGLALHRVRCSVPLAGLSFDPGADGGYRYAQEAAPLRLELAEPAAPGTRVRVELAYGGAPAPDPWGVNQLHAEWVELGMYSAWFPFSPALGAFRATVDVHLPAGWGVVGTGVEAVGADGTRLTLDEPAKDLVVLAAPGLEGRGTAAARVWARGAAPALVAGTVAEVRHQVELFGEWFGPAPGAALDVVYADRARGGGYARPGLVVVPAPEGEELDAGLVTHLAHEVSHLWWRRADATSWEDWINEGFATFSAALLAEERFGAAAGRAHLDHCRKLAAAAPPIRGLDRDHEAAHGALYGGGCALLADLDAALGRDRTLALLAEVNRRAVATTEELLAVVRERAGAAPAERLARGLTGG